MFGLCDIARLNVLVASSQQQDKYLAMPFVINTVARTKWHPKFLNSLANRLGVTRIAIRQPFQPIINPHTGLPITKPVQPFPKLGCLQGFDFLSFI